MAELKTKATNESVTGFLNKVEDQEKREDSFELLSMMKRITGEKPVLWGSSIVGFGKYHYKSERSSQEGEWPLVAFSPRKQNLTIYIMPGFANLQLPLSKLGKYKTSVGCLYIKRLSDVDKSLLSEIIKKTYLQMKKTYQRG